MLIAPSLLSSDFSKLAEEIKAVEEAGADWLHLDVMDGNFVPNLTFGPPVIKALRKHTDLVFDVHLMINSPDEHIEAYVDAGADIITVHLEACQNLPSTLEKIHALGKKAGVSLKPSTSAENISSYLHLLDMILVMTVEPGFGGQEFLVEELEKIHKIRTWIDATEKPIVLEVDGGISPQTISEVAKAGADAVVAGTSVFKGAGNYHENIQALKEAAAL